MKNSIFFFALLKDPLFPQRVGRFTFLFTVFTSLLKKYPLSIEKNFHPPFLPYLMLALINPVYQLLTDKTNIADILMIIYIHKQCLWKRHNTQVGIWFIFARQIKSGIYPFYQTQLFETFSNCHNLHICCNTASLICIEIWGWLICIG